MTRVLVVDDEPVTAAAHASYVERVEGFEVSGLAHSAGEALTMITAARDAGAPIDLVLLDLTLPDANGLELARRLRASRTGIDFIAITAVRQLDVVQDAVALGAVQYLIKPFAFATFREKLEHYRRYRERLGVTAEATTQQDVDALLSTLRSPAATVLPKGLSTPTLEAVSEQLRADGRESSATEFAQRLGLSRVTARRYLEHLADLGLATRSARYGAPGRPEVLYRWRG